MRRALLFAAIAVGVVATLFVRVGGGAPVEAAERARSIGIDLSAYPDDRLESPPSLLFIHHSCGGQLLAEPGAESGRANCILSSHPNGGGMRKLLDAQGYEVHEASYGSDIGEATDLFDWLPKFRTKMEKVLAVDENDRMLPPGKTHRIVVFKSCFPNNEIVGAGSPPGNSAGPELTLWNSKATLSALLPEFRKREDVLFVYVTAPPQAPKVPSEPLWKALIRTARGTASPKERHAQAALLARQLNDWIIATDGWLKDYPAKNVAVFDYYDVLTANGASDLSRYATGDGYDSHPSSEGNRRAAEAFVPFLNRAARRAAIGR